MDINEIKKALYKQKPIARKATLKDQDLLPTEMRGFDVYLTTINNNGIGLIIEFRIPFEDKPINLKDEEQAQLLIRWLHSI